MRTFTQFSEMIERLLGGARCVRITVEGYMPLVVEEIGASSEGRRLVALAHTGVQNGDVMHDPEIVFEFHALGGTTTPVGERASTRSAARSSCPSRVCGSATSAPRASSAPE